jgi:hypothetical protein
MLKTTRQLYMIRAPSKKVARLSSSQAFDEATNQGCQGIQMVFALPGRTRLIVLHQGALYSTTSSIHVARLPQSGVLLIYDGRKKLLYDGRKKLLREPAVAVWAMIALSLRLAMVGANCCLSLDEEKLV